MSQKLKVWLTIGVFVLWAVAIAITWVQPEYHFPVSLHVVASLVFGGLFTGGAFDALRFRLGDAEIEAERHKDDDDDDGNDDDRRDRGKPPKPPRPARRPRGDHD